MKIWFERFSKNRLFVISTEEMSKSPAHTMNQAYEFLGLPKYENTFFEKRKKARDVVYWFKSLSYKLEVINQSYLVSKCDEFRNGIEERYFTPRYVSR